MTMQPEITRRQYVGFSLYRVLPEWRRLSLAEREEHRQEFGETIRKWCVPDTMKVLTYSLVGTRGDLDMLLWRICYSIPCLQEMASDLLRTRLAGYLECPHSYLGTTRRSEYFMGSQENEPSMHGVVRPGGCKYLFLYPLVRTRNWYQLPFEDRQRMVRELVGLSRDFPRTHLHVTYSFGLDSQDFLVAVETDHPEDFVERMMRVRGLESGPHTECDTPVFACVQASVEDMLERIG